LGKMAKEKSDIYKARLEKVLKDQVKFDSKRTEPIEVAKLIRKVLLVKNSKTRYQIGHMSKLGALLENLPQSWVDSIMAKRERKSMLVTSKNKP